MKDYYYILGIKQTASIDEVKKAYRKLSLKFHPDKNDGDEFFADRFKEVLEAYEILSEPYKRQEYDRKRNGYSSTTRQPHNGTNFSPEIDFFTSSKSSFEYDEGITFSWKTINADKVSISPFGIVQPIGSKTYKIKDFKNSKLTFEIVAQNSLIGRQTKKTLTLRNETYAQLKKYFKDEIETEAKKNFKQQQSGQTSGTSTDAAHATTENDDGTFRNMIWFNALLLGGILLFLISRCNS